MKKIIPVLISAIAFVQLCSAGGGTFDAEIIDLKPKENNEYILVLRHFNTLNGTIPLDTPKEITIHLRFHPEAFGKVLPIYANESDYLNCIEKLKEQKRKGGVFRFGRMADGFRPIEGLDGHFQSNSLSYQKEYGGTYAIYSFEKKI